MPGRRHPDPGAPVRRVEIEFVLPSAAAPAAAQPAHDPETAVGAERAESLGRAPVAGDAPASGSAHVSGGAQASGDVRESGDAASSGAAPRRWWRSTRGVALGACLAVVLLVAGLIGHAGAATHRPPKPVAITGISVRPAPHGAGVGPYYQGMPTGMDVPPVEPPALYPAPPRECPTDTACWIGSSVPAGVIQAVRATFPSAAISDQEDSRLPDGVLFLRELTATLPGGRQLLVRVTRFAPGNGERAEVDEVFGHDVAYARFDTDGYRVQVQLTAALNSGPSLGPLVALSHQPVLYAAR